MTPWNLHHEELLVVGVVGHQRGPGFGPYSSLSLCHKIEFAFAVAPNGICAYNRGT